jgi:nucleotide-binding universal stress UspA family protein
MSPIRTILHPTDFSAYSEHALELAAALARDYQARLIIMHAVEPMAIGFDGMVVPRSEEELDALHRKLEEVRPKNRDIAVQHEFVKDDPVTAILRTIAGENCDLVVMGTHGRTGLGRLLMGSVAEQIVRKAACPVLTVKTPMSRPELKVEATGGRQSSMAAGDFSFQ